MKMKLNNFASLAVATTIGLFTPLSSQAFGLGQIAVHSALNEPFRAEIEVTALRPDERGNLQVRLASGEEFEKAGLVRSMLLNRLQFDIVEQGAHTKILITSDDPVKEPFLDFLITATAGQGRMLREYTVLLDPPEFVRKEMHRSTAAPSPVERSPAATPLRSQPESSVWQGDRYRVQRSDTLWNVALKTRPSRDISVHQMMMALHSANPDAFSHNNVNGLKAGYTLRIPSESEIRALSQAQAVAAFNEQTEQWKNRQRPAAQAVVAESAPAMTEEAGEPDSAASETGATEAVEPQQVDPEAGDDSDARLKLVVPDDNLVSQDNAPPNVRGGEDIDRLSEQLTLAQETIEAQAQENLDFRARMDAMEEQLETLRRLVSIKDAEMARLQRQLEDEDPELAAQMGALAGTDDVDAVDPSQQSDTGAEETVQQDEGLLADTARMLDMDVAEVNTIVDRVKAFVSEHRIESGVGVLLLLLVLWLVARRRNREMSWDEAVGQIEKESGNTTRTVAAAAVSETAATELTDAPRSDINLKSVPELIEQADMFIGYADYIQARTSLEQAMQQEPDNELVTYKLLFVLYKQKLAQDFLSVVRDNSVDASNTHWDEIAQWGRELLPDDAQFTEKQDVAVEQTAGGTGREDEAGMDSLQQDVAESGDAEPLAFDLEQPADSAGQPAPEQPKVRIDDEELLKFDASLSGDTDAINDGPEGEAQQEIDSLSIERIDLDVPLSDDAPEDADSDISLQDWDADAGDEAETLELEDTPDLSFDIDELEDIDEAETKLDLAAAYIDMGDPDGARNILNEVLVEGNETQKERAQTLLDTLS